MLKDEEYCALKRVEIAEHRYLPLVAFGTFMITGDDLIFNTLNNALKVGYRHIDTATVYNNEESIGKALKILLPKHGIKREDLYITSKLSPSDHGKKAYDAVKKSLKKLDCEYLDLYLIHWPAASGIPMNSDEHTKIRSQSWEGLVKAKKEGLVKDIGVSNYTIKHLKELLANDHGVRPLLNQVEWHPKYFQPELQEFCKQENIILQAYSCLGGTGNKDLMSNPTVVDIAETLKKSPSQVLLRWAIQQNVAIITKARSEEHIKENFSLDFILPDNYIERLNSLNSNTKYAWNPDNVA